MRRVGLNKLPSQVIQRRAEFVEKIADNDTQIQRGFGQLREALKGFTISALLSNDLAFLLVPLDLSVYQCEMLLSPDDFMTDAV